MTTIMCEAHILFSSIWLPLTKIRYAQQIFNLISGDSARDVQHCVCAVRTAVDAWKELSNCFYSDVEKKILQQSATKLLDRVFGECIQHDKRLISSIVKIAFRAALHFSKCAAAASQVTAISMKHTLDARTHKPSTQQKNNISALAPPQFKNILKKIQN